MSRSKNTQSMLKTRFEELKEMEKETQSMTKILEEYKNRIDSNLESPNSFKNWISSKKHRKVENKINFKNSKIKFLPDKKTEPSIVETPFKPFTKFPSIFENEKKSKATNCGQCSLRTAILICNECFEYYCQECFGEMHNKGNMLKHSVTSLENFGLKTSKSVKSNDGDKKVPEIKLVENCTQESQLVPGFESSDKSTEMTIKPVDIKFKSSGLTYGQRLLLQRLKQLDFSPSEQEVRNSNKNVLNSSIEEDKQSKDSYNSEMVDFSRSLLADPSKLQHLNPELTGSTDKEDVKENVTFDISSIPNVEPSNSNVSSKEKNHTNPKEDLIIDILPTPAVELSQPNISDKGETKRRRKKGESAVKQNQTRSRRPRSNCSMKSVDCRNFERQLTQITPQIKETEGIKYYKVSGLSNFYSLTSSNSKNVPQSTTPKLSYNFYKLSPKSWSISRTLELEDPTEFVKYEETQQNDDTIEDLDVTISPKVEDPPKGLKQSDNVATVSFSLSRSMDGQPNLDLFSSIDSTQISSENDSMADDECESDETVNDLEKQLEMSIENQKMNENDKFREFMYVMLDTTKSYSMSSSESSGESYGSITTVCPEDEVHSLR